VAEERSSLNAGTSATLNASGAATVELGPDSSRGPATWRVNGVILLSSRPGVAPISRAVVYQDDASNPANAQGLSYDGSFAQGSCDITLTRGQKLICQWTGGQSGDRVSMTLTGEKW
jgi:hypothetical protein